MLEKKIELIKRSADRLERGIRIQEDSMFWKFMRRELWIHWKRTTEALWMVIRKKK